MIKHPVSPEGERERETQGDRETETETHTQRKREGGLGRQRDREERGQFLTEVKTLHPYSWESHPRTNRAGLMPVRWTIP